jgi:hypothetical protein
MKRLIVFILLLPFNSIAQDALLQAIYGNWYNQEKYESEYKDKESSVSEIPNTSDEEADYYSWNLGTPDNIPETIIIYQKECSCY